MYGQRVLVSSGAGAEGDNLYGQGIYNDTTGNLTVGMPLFYDVTDAAQFNGNIGGQYGSTALSPAVVPSGGNFLLSTNANAGANPLMIGIYQPDNPSDVPAKGAPVKFVVLGRCVASAAAKTAGTAVTVGGVLTIDTTQTSLLAVAAAIRIFAGIALATKTFLTSGTTIIAVPGSGTTTALVNAAIRPS